MFKGLVRHYIVPHLFRGFKARSKTISAARLCSLDFSCVDERLDRYFFQVCFPINKGNTSGRKALGAFPVIVLGQRTICAGHRSLPTTAFLRRLDGSLAPSQRVRVFNPFAEATILLRSGSSDELDLAVLSEVLFYRNKERKRRGVFGGIRVQHIAFEKIHPNRKVIISLTKLSTITRKPRHGSAIDRIRATGSECRL